MFRSTIRLLRPGRLTSTREKSPRSGFSFVIEPGEPAVMPYLSFRRLLKRVMTESAAANGTWLFAAWPWYGPDAGAR